MPLMFNQSAVFSPSGDTPKLLRAEVSGAEEMRPTQSALSLTGRLAARAPQSTRKSKRARQVTLADDIMASAPVKRRILEFVFSQQPSSSRSETPCSSFSSAAEDAGHDLFSILMEPGFSASTPQADSASSLSSDNEPEILPAGLTYEGASQTNLMPPPISLSPTPRSLSPLPSSAAPPSCSLSPPCRRPSRANVCPDAPRRDLINLPREDGDNSACLRRASSSAMRFRSVLARLVNAH